MDLAGEGLEENCTEWNISCLQADVEDPMLNPWLQPVAGVRYWIDGVVLPCIVILALIANCVLISGVSCIQGRTSDWIMGLLSLTSTLLLISLTVRRVPPALGYSLYSPTLTPLLLTIDKGLNTLYTLTFVIFIGDRHLRTIELRSYSWVRPFLFCLTVSILVSIPVIWEYSVHRIGGDQLTQMIDLSQSPLSAINISNMTEVEVLRRTELWHDNIYRNMVRYLVTLLTSQVATIWLLPIIFLHSRDINETLRRKRKRAGMIGRLGDPLVPILCFIFMFLSLPSLAHLIIQILLYRPPLLIYLLSSLSLSVLVLLVPLLTIILDPDIKRRVLCSIYLHRKPLPRPLPTEEF